MSTDRLKFKENVVHIQGWDYYSALKTHHRDYEIMPLVATRMDLGGSYIKWSETEKDKRMWYRYRHIFFLIYEGKAFKTPQNL